MIYTTFVGTLILIGCRQHKIKKKYTKVFSEIKQFGWKIIDLKWTMYLSQQHEGIYRQGNPDICKI